MKIGAICSCSAVTIYADKGALVESGLFWLRDGPKYKSNPVVARTTRRDTGMLEEKELASTL